MEGTSTIPEGTPDRLSAHEYKSEIRKRLGDTKVNLTILIDTIISLYGINISEKELQNILLLVLECEPYIAAAISKAKEFTFYYDTVLGYGVIIEK